MINAYESASYLHDQYLWELQLLYFCSWSDYDFLNLNRYQLFYAEYMVRVHSKDYKNLKKLIIVYVKLYWIYNFYYGIETAMSYLFALVVLLWKLL